MLKVTRWFSYLFIFSLVAFLSPLFISKSFAATNVPTGPSYTTSPVTLNVAIHPGTSYTKTIQIMNNSSQPVPIVMRVDVFGAYGSTGQAEINAPSSNNPSPSYVHFSPASFTAQPKVWSLVQMTITLPKTASLGYYLAIVFQPNTPNASAAPGRNIFKSSNSILVLVDTQSANEVRSVEVGQFSTNKKLFEYLPVKFSVDIHNSGNIFLDPSGDIYISRSPNLTHTIATLGVNGAGGNVLPNSDRIFSESWSAGFPVFEDKTVNGNPVTDKKGNPVEQLKWDLANIKDFRFGRYYAGLTLVYNNGSRIVPLKAVISFWVIPWKLLLVLLVILVLIGFALWSAGRGIYRKIKKIKTNKTFRRKKNQ